MDPTRLNLKRTAPTSGAEYIAARRETAINHYLGVLEALDNESFEASAQTCMETIDMQKAIVSGAVE